MVNHSLDICAPINQSKIFSYKKYLDFFIKLQEMNSLPNKMLFSGEMGIGKSTFAYHFIDISQVRKMITYTNKTTFNDKLKFVLIDNIEFLNISSVNSLLKIVEEPNNNTYFILIYNSHKNIIKTLKSRCIEFKFSFSKDEKKLITNNLFDFHSISDDLDFRNSACSYYDSPGFIFRLHLYLSKNNHLNNDFDLNEVIFDLLNSDFPTYNNENFKLFIFLFELSMYKKFLNSNNRNKLYNIYFKTLNKINISQKYNLDLKNLFFELKQIYTNAI